jgi:hypothetical protein
MSREKSWKEIAPAGVCSKSSVGFMTGDWKTYTPVREMHVVLDLCDVLSRWRHSLAS